MNASKANWHAVVAVAAVIGAEFEVLKDQTSAQLAAHTWVFWLCMICAIVVALGNSKISTHAPADQPSVTVSPAPPPPASVPALSSVPVNLTAPLSP